MFLLPFIIGLIIVIIDGIYYLKKKKMSLTLKLTIIVGVILIIVGLIFSPIQID